MIRALLMCGLFMAVIAPAGCAATDMAQLRASLLETDRQWAEAVRGDDADRIASFWTDDAVIYVANRPPVAGKEALRAFVAKNRSIPGFSLSWDVSDVAIAESGDLAYTLGPYELTAPSPEGGLTTLRGNHICVWRRENERWRCSIEVHAPLPPQAPRP